MNTGLPYFKGKGTSKLEPTLDQLTRREYFAALALQTILQNSVWIEFSQPAKERGIITDKSLEVAKDNSKKIAEICVMYADALLTQLEVDI